MMSGFGRDGEPELVNDLYETLLPKCRMCHRPATRSLKLKIVIGDPLYFCDEHELGSTDKWKEIGDTSYEDLYDAPLRRRALNYLKTHEVKT
jgi:hypothetical protein